jgi:bifunctional DNA-binding transcriptional regulator/antitoxin component of YhaV-PrlF toxin-antitoxin module
LNRALAHPLKGKSSSTIIGIQISPFGMTNGTLTSMEAIVTMDRFGRLVLPGPIRKALPVSQLAAFKAEVMGNKVELTLVAPESGAVLKKRRGLLVVSTGGRKFDAGEAVRGVRGERI